MTFHAYQRMQRINGAYCKLREGETVTDAALDHGYESLSGFGHSFKQATGVAPSQSKGLNVIFVHRIATPLGTLLAGANDDGICLLEFTDRRMLETQLERVQKRLKSTTLTGKHRHFETLNTQLTEYFAGERKSFDVPLVTAGTKFQEKVWSALRTIPAGSTRSYAEQARLIERPTAVRAVARANGDNRISILIPCHRVIGSDGKLTGYGGGLWRKEKLLQLERGEITL